LAAVDATKEKDLGDKYNVKGFPTGKLYLSLCIYLSISYLPHYLSANSSLHKI